MKKNKAERVVKDTRPLVEGLVEFPEETWTAPTVDMRLQITEA